MNISQFHLDAKLLDDVPSVNFLDYINYNEDLYVAIVDDKSNIRLFQGSLTNSQSFFQIAFYTYPNVLIEAACWILSGKGPLFISGASDGYFYEHSFKLASSLPVVCVFNIYTNN